jgi:hypothetical protein
VERLELFGVLLAAAAFLGLIGLGLSGWLSLWQGAAAATLGWMLPLLPYAVAGSF